MKSSHAVMETDAVPKAAISLIQIAPARERGEIPAVREKLNPARVPRAGMNPNWEWGVQHLPDCAETGFDGGDCSGGETGGGLNNNPEDTDSECSDGTDNDGDFLTDCEDPSCADAAPCVSGTGGGNGTCPAGEISSCSGATCWDESELGNGECNSFLDCAETNFDGGDCVAGSGGGGTDCPVGEVPSCSGLTCWDEAKLGDGTCDEYLNCLEYNNDEGDCGVEF